MSGDAIKINGDVPTRSECVYVARMHEHKEPHTITYYQTLRALMLAGFCLLFLIGCSSTPKFTVETITPDQFTVTVEGFASKQDDTITAVKANTEAIEKIVVKVQSLEGAILETRKSLEASLVKSEAANSQEVIQESSRSGKSGNDTAPVQADAAETESPDKNANDFQTSQQDVAESGDAVSSIQVWSTSWCKHCPATIKAAESVAKEFGIKCQILKDQPAEEVERCKITCYPTITLVKNGAYVAKLEAGQDKDSLRKWLKEQGLKPVEFPQTSIEPTPIVPQAAQTTTQDLVELHNSLHGGGSWTWPGDLAEHLRNTHGVDTNVVGTHYEKNPVVRSRSVVSTVSRGPVVNWRGRSVLRSNCPGGRCP